MAAKNGGRLNDREERFVEEYLKDLNGTQAAIRAGYSEKGASTRGAALLRNVRVSAAITIAKAKRAAETGITAERVLAELETLAFSNIVSHYFIDDAGNIHLADGAPKNALAAIQTVKRKSWSDGEGGHTVEVEVRLHGKIEPLKLAGRHVGLFGNEGEAKPPVINVFTGMAPASESKNG